MTTVKNELIQLAERLPEDASWQDVIYELYLTGKVDLGLAKNERGQVLSKEDVTALFVRAELAHDVPADMRNTMIYHPGNTTTVAMVAGVIAAGFAFVFPPISWLAAPVALIAGIMGILGGQPRAWVAVLLSLVTFLPFLTLFSPA
jgi:type IV secretory pathway VirB2 component (pilin)